MASPTLFILLLFLCTDHLLSSASLLPNPVELNPIPIINPIGDGVNLPQPPVAPPALISFTNGKGIYKSMAREFIRGHNSVRAGLGEAPFKWDRNLARYARRWSEHLRTDCNLTHSGGPYGENMFWGTGWDWKATDAVKYWADENEYYNQVDNSCQPGMVCGHFTQMVWNTTTRFGCGRSECYGGGVIITCSYDPPGNYVGEKPF